VRGRLVAYLGKWLISRLGERKGVSEAMVSADRLPGDMQGHRHHSSRAYLLWDAHLGERATEARELRFGPALAGDPL